jgi:flagellar basal-body rod protein FlgB
MNIIDPATLALVGKALDAASLRQAVHAHNIANANAEGFVPSRVSFESHLQQLRDTLSRGDRITASDVADVSAVVELEPAGAKVELDTEVTALARNGLQYQALIKAIDRELSLMSLAVSDGRR